MNHHITRRAALAAPAVLAVAPAAVAPAAAVPSADPAVAAYQQWHAIREAQEAHYKVEDDDTPEGARLHQLEWEARRVISTAKATTLEGIAAQIKFAFDVFGHLDTGGSCSNLEDYYFEYWEEDLDGTFLRTLLANVQRLAEGTA